MKLAICKECGKEFELKTDLQRVTNTCDDCLYPIKLNKEVKMANISDFVKQRGEFLKADSVKQDTKAEITGESEIVHNEKYDTDRLHIPVKVEDKEYTFDASRTNARVIAETLGEDTSKWIGKTLLLETYKTKTSEGKMTLAINVKSVVI